MAEQNPIKYSDLISPDDSIERLIAQLENLQSTYEGMASSIQQRAAAVAASLRTVSGATSQGQHATKKASEDADKLAKAYRDLAFAESENAKKLAELKLAQKEANDLNKLTIKLNQSAEGSYNALSAQYSINKIYLNNMTKEERENTEAGRKLEKETKAIYDEMNRLQQATGKMSLNVGNYTNSINSVCPKTNCFTF
jgi:chromosome segregation ATPase